MVERLTITAMGKQKLRERMFDAALTALKNLRFDASDDERALHVVSAIVCCGDYQEFTDHGAWHERASHQ